MIRSTEISEEIQEQLQQISEQLGQPKEAAAIIELCMEAQDLLSHLSTDELTLARVAAVLLVYQLPGTDPNEANWFRTALKECPDNESAEELIDSISRPDSL
jgi:hypothetical protein